MPGLTLLGALEDSGTFAHLVRCDGVDAAPAEERVASDRVWFVLRGRFHLRGARTRRAGDPATALFLRRDEPFCIRHPEGCGDLCLSIGGALVETIVDRRGDVAPLGTASFVALHAIARRLARRENVEPLEVGEALCAAVDATEPARDASPRERRVAADVALELALRFDERLSLGALAAPHRVSAFALCRAFRRVHGTTIHRTLQQRRVRHALALMLDTDWTLARIAAECGFAHHAHLTTLMRRELGATPSRIRASGGRVLMAGAGSAATTADGRHERRHRIAIQPGRARREFS